VPGLRPTPERVRETLFNWLQGRLSGARCLDLFAGSGALGLEALSRGANSVLLVERDPRLVGSLRASISSLGSNQVEVELADAVSFLRRPPQRFDLVFLDPPFHRQLLPPVSQLLEGRDWLSPRALIYVESERRLAPPGLPAHWLALRRGVAGEVSYQLFERNELAG
jgi:16S rRNA (guanine966-N2)-methyltransferase